MPVYEKSVQELMKDFASEVRGVFRFPELRQWFRDNYPSMDLYICDLFRKRRRYVDERALP